ncbi:hypothetical protein T492DRAFT_1006031 [Pavlovales sp. CCMP2436]|nr:hypothetical protein T492DRAFT_1006031 [Pavlovales sp. CCMP2436]
MALCLVCGGLVCVGAKHCHTRHGGGCASHAAACGAHVGVFLLLHTSDVLVRSGARISFWGSPYLDVYGEQDIGLERGRPLHLNVGRYNELRELWLSQGFDHDPTVLEFMQVQSHY